MSSIPKIVDWRGPKGWNGQAVKEYREFPFQRLPWTWIRHEDQSAFGAVCVKSSNSRRVYRVDLAEFSGGAHSGSAFAKRYLANNLRRRLGLHLSGAKAGQEFALGLEMRRRGLPTPQPLAWAVHFGRTRVELGRHKMVLPPASYLLTLEWPNDGSVRDWLKLHPSTAADVIPALARFLAGAHRLGFYHDDCAADHILIRRAPFAATGFEFCFIDVDNGRLSPSPLPLRQRVSNLFQIFRSVPFKLLSPKQRLTFLELYLAEGGEEGVAGLDDLVAAVEKTATRKVGRTIVRR